MEFKNTLQIIDAFGAAEKRVNSNYVEFLNRFFPDWEMLKTKTRKDGKNIDYINKRGKRQFTIRYRNKNLEKVELIDVFANSNAFLGEEVQSTKPFVRAKMNRRSNATLLRYYAKNSWINVKDEYVDVNFEPFLTINYGQDEPILGYDFECFGESSFYETEEALVEALSVPNIKGFDFQSRSLQAVNTVFEGRKVKFSFEYDVVDMIDDVHIGIFGLDEFQVTKLDKRTLMIEIPDDLPIKKGTHDLKVEVKGIEFNIANSNLLFEPVDNRSTKIDENDENVLFWYGNVKGNYALLSRAHDLNLERPITSGSPILISDVLEVPTGLFFKLSLPVVNNIQFFSQYDGKQYVIPHTTYAPGYYVLDVSQVPQEMPIFVKYTQTDGKQQQKLLSLKSLQRNFVKNTKLDRISSQKDGTLDLHVTMPIIGLGQHLVLVLKNRGSKESVFFDVQETQVLDDYFMEGVFKVKLSEFPLPEEFDVRAYDPTIYDVSLEFGWRGLSKFYVPVRVNLESEIDEEIFGKFDEETEYMINPYGTSNKNELSLRTYFLTNEAASYYRWQVETGKDALDEQRNAEKDNSKPVIVVIESPNKAQDNGLHFFKYMLEKRADEVDAYYVVDASSPDLPNLEPYMDKVLIYKSVHHFEMMAKADAVIHTNSSFYAYPINTSFWKQYQLDAKKVFLQHGIIGVRNLANLYGKNPMFTDRFMVSSVREKNLVVDEMGYSSDEVVIAGLTRFDTLLKDSSPERSYDLRKNILIMPSWRKGQDRLTDEDFVKTDFYQSLHEFINKPSLVEQINEKGLNISLYLHHNFQKYSHLFEDAPVSVILEEETTVQELLLNNGLLITDFSSVALDFALQERKVFYYQLDDAILSEVDELANFFPGKIYFDADAVINDVVEAVDNPQLSLEEETKLDNLYLQRDLKASERTYEVVNDLLNDETEEKDYQIAAENGAQNDTGKDLNDLNDAYEPKQSSDSISVRLKKLFQKG